MRQGSHPGDMWQALNLSCRCHEGQYRKAVPVPYVIHPLRVANLLLSYRLPEHPLAIAALLHDTVEHGLLTVTEIEREFGPEVRRLVEALPAPDPAAPWRERKAAAIDQLRTVADDVLTLACADKLDNL